MVLDAPSHVHLAYRPGVPLVAGVWVGGRPLYAPLAGLVHPHGGAPVRITERYKRARGARLRHP